MKRLLILSLSCFSFLFGVSQGILNEGAKIVVEENAVISITGESGHFTNTGFGLSQGEVNSEGTINISGNWGNSGSNAFVGINSKGLVVFNEGREHTIVGSSPTHFEGVNIQAADTLTIPAGKEIFVRNTCTIEGKVIVEGILNIQNELVLNGTIEGNGKICYCGTNPQFVVGGSFGQTIEIKNIQGCSLADNLTINKELILTQGALKLGDFDLHISLTAGLSRVAAATNFIDATGAGYLFKEFDQPASYTYILGNAASPAFYTPVSINFSGGTFNNASLGMRLKNQKHPKNQDMTNYLKRYWEFSASGISNFSYDATYHYDPVADVVGNEAQITGAWKNPVEEFLWDETGQVDFTNHTIETSGVNHFSTTTGIDICGPIATIESNKIYCAGDQIEINALFDQIFCHSGCDLPQGYCESTGILYFLQYISKVQLGDSTHTSGYSNYSDFTGGLFKALYLDSTYSFQIEIENSNAQQHFAGVYFDWNRDGDFDDANETYLLGMANGTANFNQNIVVPSGAVLGKTLMRIVDRHQAQPVSCGSYSIGETEDYLIEIRDMDPASIVSYSWTGPDGWASASRENDLIEVGSGNSGAYNLSVTDIYNCADQASVNILVADPQISFPVDTIYTMQPETLYYYPGVFDSYLWSNGSTIPFLIPENYGTYSVSVTQYQCSDVDSISILEVQEIPLHEGWGIFSSYINTTIPMSDLFSGIMNNIIIVKNYQGDVLTNLFGGVNSIGHHVVGQSYLYKCLNPELLIVYGSAVNPSAHPIQLNAGHFYLGYLRKSDAPVSQLFSSITSHINILKNEMGLVYWPTFGINQIGNMSPGAGYLVSISSSTVYFYPSNETIFAKSVVTNPEHQYYACLKSTGANMTLGIPLSAWSFDIKAKDEIGIFSGDGRLVGSGVFENHNLAMTLWGNDELLTMKTGIDLNEAFSIEHWDHSTGQISRMHVSHWIQGNGKYAENEIAIVGKIGLEPIINSLNISNYPNPFSTFTTIQFSIPKDGFYDISILDDAGRNLESIATKMYDVGNYSIRYQSEGLASGNYYLVLSSSSGERAIKQIQKIE